MDQQIFKFEVSSGNKESQETSNSDKLTNLELWGVNVDFKAYQKIWTVDAILQHMGFYSPTENPCVTMRENLKTQSSEYIVICQDDLYIASTTPEEIFHILQDKLQKQYLSRR